MKITAVLMAHNEESLIEQALRSVRKVADEVLVGHDGPCRDRTLELARPLVDELIEFDFRGAPEVNTIKLLRRASHDWILRIDCDETLSDELVQAVLQVKQGAPEPGVTHYTCFWINMMARDPESLPATEPNRVLLFDRTRTTWVGIPHRTPQVTGKPGGLRAGLLHWAPHQNYSTYELITKRLLPFAKRDAKIRVTFPLETYGFDPAADPRSHIQGRDRLRHQYPLLSSVPLATLAASRSLLNALKADSIAEVRSNLRWPLAHGVYQLALGYNIARERRRAHRDAQEPSSEHGLAS